MIQPLNSSDLTYQKITSLLLYQSVFDNEVGESFIELLLSLGYRNENIINLDCLIAYSAWFKALATYQRSWQDYLVNQILLNDNPFSQQIQTISLRDLPTSLVDAIRHDLKILQSIYSCQVETIAQWVQNAALLNSMPVVWKLDNAGNTFLHQQDSWENALDELANYYRQRGTGIFAQYRALRWQIDKLVGIPNPDPIQLREIVGYEAQKEALVRNTEILLAGYPTLHVLLYGSRGSGKSSLVKALLNQYDSQGLRLVEVSKSELQNLPIIVEKLRNLPQKFIIFVDDLSFEEDDDAFKALKVVLEGSVTARAQNVVVYATSNRRHLIREFFDERPRPRDGEEIHGWDTVQEKLSFSDRFGLALTFEPANQETYLRIVHSLAQEARINLPSEELEFRAKQWATQHNGRSGRTARQFIDFLQGELLINRSLAEFRDSS